MTGMSEIHNAYYQDLFFGSGVYKCTNRCPADGHL